MNNENRDLIEAIDILEKEKSISRDVLFETLKKSLEAACKSQYKNSDNNFRVEINRETGAVAVYTDVEVVEDDAVFDPNCEMGITTANEKFPEKKYQLGDIVSVEITPKDFMRKAAHSAKQQVVQSIREEEGKVLLNEYLDKQDQVVTGTVQRYLGRNISVNLGKVDGILVETEQIKGEYFRHGDRIKVFVVEVKSGKKGPKITLSRTHPELVKRLFEREVTEVKAGIVEIVGISRDPGSRTKIAVRSIEPTIDAIGACVGPNGIRVNAVVEDLGGEKIDIIQWSENPEIYIRNALSPAKTISVSVDPETRTARVIVPDSQFSLAIGREGQNAKLAHRLTGYKIDIKSDASPIE